MVFTTERVQEEAIESLLEWEWDLNPRTMNSVRRCIKLSYQAMSSIQSQSQICTAILLLSVHILF